MMGAFEGERLEAILGPWEICGDRFVKVDVGQPIGTFDEIESEPGAKRSREHALVPRRIVGKHGETDGIGPGPGEAGGDNRGVESARHTDKKPAMDRCDRTDRMLD